MRFARLPPPLIGLAVLLLPVSLALGVFCATTTSSPAKTTSSSSLPLLPTVTIKLPASTVAGGGSGAVSDSLLAYTQPDPLLQTPPPNSTDRFTNFHIQVFVVHLQLQDTHLVASPPQLLFRGSQGTLLTLWSILGGWLVYSQYAASDPAGSWALIAHNVASNQEIVLDTSTCEGLPSLPAQAASDGHTVVWQSWTLVHGSPVSVIRSYAFDTRQKHVLAEGGSLTTWSYAWPSVSGQQVIFEKDMPYTHPPTAQIMAADMITGQVHALTAATSANSEPSISGDVVVWKAGWRYGAGQGVVIYNIQTGTQRILSGLNIEQPKIAASRYVIFPAGSPTSVQLYDIERGTRTTLAGPQKNGYRPGNIILAGGHVVVYYLSKPSQTTPLVPIYLVVISLP